MFRAASKCPHCHGTYEIRDAGYGGFAVGECGNCRFDRRDELPGPAADQAQEKLPPGVKAVNGTWYTLDDGKKVRKAEYKKG